MQNLVALGPMAGYREIFFFTWAIRSQDYNLMKLDRDPLDKAAF